MSEEVKKISFGFSRLTKKSSIVSSTQNVIKPDEKKIEFIDCLEGKSIKLKDPIELKNKPLVIPLKRQVEVVPNLEQEHAKNVHLGNNKCQEEEPPGSNEVVNKQTTEIDKDDQLHNDSKTSNATKSEILTLDEIAAKEILEDLNRKKTQEETRIFSVPLTSNAPTGEKESSLDDYDNIPVNDFGMAMLRGMGWAPGKGIGKTEKFITPSILTVRPKGMGLGADKVIKAATDSKPLNEDLKMTKGSFVRIIAGPQKDSYGQIEGFDDESSRVIVKLALKSHSVSLNEFMIQLVDKVEFTKNSKVINVSKYEQYKEDEGKKDSNKIKQEDISKDYGLRKGSSNDSDNQQTTNSIKSSIKDLKRDKRSPDKPKFTTQRSSSSEGSPQRYVKDKRSSPPRKSRESALIRSSSSEEKCRKSRYSRSPPAKKSVSGSRNDVSLASKHERNSSSTSRRKYRHSSSSSRTSSSSSGYSKKKRERTKKKKPSSRKHKSRSRSRSPRKVSSHKKHKKSKY